MRLPPEFKEKLRQEFDQIRNVYETDFLGAFEQIYPCAGDPDKTKTYKSLLESSRLMHDERSPLKH